MNLIFAAALMMASSVRAAEPDAAVLPGFDAPVPVSSGAQTPTAHPPAVKKRRKRPPALPKAKARKAKPDVPGPTAAGGYAAPHKKRHKKTSAAPALPAKPSGPDRVPLPDGRWTSEVRSALERLLASRGSDAPGFDPDNPPLAVVSLDALAAAHSPGDALFSLLVDSAGFRCDAPFWKLVPVSVGRERIRAGFDAFHAAPRAVWTKDASYLMYRKAFYKARREVCSLWGAQECARWKASLLSGFTVEQATTAVRAALERSLEMPVGMERVGDYAEDPEPVEVQPGLRRIPEIEDLCLKLREKGFELWAMSLSDQNSAEAFALTYGPPGASCFEAERVLGVRPVPSSGTLTAEIFSPVPHGTGQAELFLQKIGRAAALVVGGAESQELFKLSELSVRVSPEEALPGVGTQRDARALSQPAFKPVRQPQPLPTGR